jgi:hypothetical protein
MKISKYQPPRSLKPTQFSIGMEEIKYRTRKLEKLGSKKLHRLIRKTKVPVIVSPWKELYVTDHHHYIFACSLAGVPKVRIHIIKDCSKSRTSYRAFWRQMARERHAYMQDQFGDGPRSPLYLPNDIRGLADDPYRSLAWLVRKEGGYEDSDEPFAEYKWANLFRRRRLLESHGRHGLHRAVKQSLDLARSPAAKKLPGYIGVAGPVRARPNRSARKSR